MRKALVIISTVIILSAALIWWATKHSMPANKQAPNDTAPLTQKQADNQIAGIDIKKLITTTSAQGLQPKALKAALNAYFWARDHNKLGQNKNILTVVDFSLPSYLKRMWVIDLHQYKILMKLHTTQGAGSGLVYATHFSNQHQTQASSLGLYVTSNEYYGNHGKSMRLDGLQKGINDQARDRNIVIHAADYVTTDYIRANHRAGRSWGCFAISPSQKETVLHYIKGGSAFFAYAKQIEKNILIKNGPLTL